MTFDGEKEHHFREQLAHWLAGLEHQVEHNIRETADELIFHHEHPAHGYARIVMDCHAGPHEEYPYHAQEDFPISQLGSQPRMGTVVHALATSIVTMEAAHALDLGCPANLRIDLKYKGHERTISAS